MARGIGVLAVVVALGVAPAARAQSGAAGQGGLEQVRRGDPDLQDRCVRLLSGETVEGEDLARLRSRCEALVRAGTSRAPAEPGEAVRTSFTQAGSELFGRGQRMPMGSVRSGPVRNTLMTNPIGWFSGLGVNAEYSRPLPQWDRISFAVAGNYARANASNGNVTSFGAGGGLDLFILGRNNEGLRLGGRLGFSIGNEDVGNTTTFARMNAGGELGYRFIASNGISAGITFGLGGRIAGDQQNTQFESLTGSGEFGPYFKLGAGYSW